MRGGHGTLCHLRGAPPAAWGAQVQAEGLPATASRLSEYGVRETWLQDSLTARRRRRLVPSLQHGLWEAWRLPRAKGTRWLPWTKHRGRG